MELTFQNLDKMNVNIRGAVGKGTDDEWIFQNAPQGHIKYPGPKLPANPRTWPQQINRYLFRYASEQAKLLSPSQIEELRNEIIQNQLHLTWRTLFLQKFLTGQWPPM